ncbi:carbohydrate-binding module family 21 protein [Patellaria atrata CBS 101060]|uniref:Carbohydrate-binding module family 21 protein n=1 Tax=Patellaria atrata CBS 101060 TaxID=1346257 RepID=A0A9P4VKX8_9PEZI|nr:carbohydrate-binding module family 21 protein [Patellaria atrata CBS 101060]
MPYTPPSQRSPASSKANSPVISRSHSYSSEFPTGPNHVPRPALPRSVSSTSYLNKHRRSPSISQANGDQSQGVVNPGSDGKVPSTNGSLRQAPSPVNDSLIPSGAVTTPPDSLQNSDDEERGRSMNDLVELHQALQSIDLKRGLSPDRASHLRGIPGLDRSGGLSRPLALTPEARKISHSRSSSEIQLSKLSVLPQSSTVTSSDDDGEDDELRIKPPLLRKKSGELVKPALRPPSRRRPSSMPGTPTFSKAVHFNEDIEQVRHFLQVDRPIAVSAGSSPVENYDSDNEYPFYQDGYKPRKVEWEIRLANFPRETFERNAQPVKVERIFLSADNITLVGSVAVANIAFQKLVVARFTLDYWKTTSEVVAEYNNDVRKKQQNDGYDRFNFNIKLADQANLESKTLLLCVRYNVNGQELWDNNNNMNYQVDFIKKPRIKVNAKGIATHGCSPGSTGSLGAIPRSRQHPPTARPHSMPSSLDDDFGSGFNTKYEFGSTRALMDESPHSTIRFKNNKNKGRGNLPLFPDQAQRRSNPTGQAFSTRYDFGASLSAALSNAQNTLGDRNPTPPAKEKEVESKPQFVTEQSITSSPLSTTSPAVSTSSARPDVLSSEKPDVKSAEYNELIQKFCFFGSGTSSPQNTPKQPQPYNYNNGARDFDTDSSGGSNQNSGTNSPPSPMPRENLPVDGANDTINLSTTPSPFLSRSTSPGPVTGSAIGDRAASPVSFGYPFHQNMHGGIFSEPHTPTAILG